jgi:hypothetical protein
MRWRMLVNALERTSARDTLARFSIAIEKLGPLLALALLIPSIVALFVLGIVAGFGVATGSWTLPFQFVRFFLLASVAVTLFGPVILPARDADHVVRLLLLPVSRLTLYVAHVTSALADPWVLLTVPMVLGVPVGLAIGLHFVTAAAALAAGLAFVVFLAGLTSLAASVIHLLLRDRRRGDLVMLIVVVLISSAAMLPSLMQVSRAGHRRLTRAERQALPPSTADLAIRRVAPYVPSELYRNATLDSQRGSSRAAFPLAGLVAVALAAQAAAFAAFRRVLDMPVSMGARTAGAFGGIWERAIPGLTRGASAVALTQLRLALRSPRGRQSMLMPEIVFAMFAVVLARNGDIPFPGLKHAGGLGLAIFGCLISMLATGPFAFNQFAVDRAGFTRQMLVPLSVRDLLMGKAVGNMLIMAAPALLCWAAAAILFPGAGPALWIAIPIAFTSAYLVFAPLAAIVSAVFPRTVDLGSIGSKSNAHQAANLLGVLSIVVSAAPPLGLALAAVWLLDRAPLVPVLLAVWCAAAYGVFQLLLMPTRRFVESRREDLGLTH